MLTGPPIPNLTLTMSRISSILILNGSSLEASLLFSEKSN